MRWGTFWDSKIHFYNNTIGKYELLSRISSSNPSQYEELQAGALLGNSTHLGNLLKVRVDWTDLTVFNNFVA